MPETMGDTKNYQANGQTGTAASEPGDVVIVYCTFASVEAAKAAGRALVEHRLAACVNVFPGMTAIYEWEGAVHEDREVAMIVKTLVGRAGDVFTALKAGHSYANPALVSLDVRAGTPAYLAWIKAQVGGV